MTDKEKIKAEIERLRESSLASESYHDALDDLLVFIDSMHEELVSEDLKKAANKYADNSDYVYADVSIEDFTVETFKAGAKWQKEQMMKDAKSGMGNNNNLWKPADGDDLPEYEREVIVLTQPYPLEDSEFAVSFAHRPNPEGWDGKSITTGKVEHYTPKTYEKGGWNIPDIKYWLDVELPKDN